MATATKPSIEEVASKDVDSIIVHLYLRGPYSIPKRRLVLTHARPVIPIGRSSKVRTKGFVPSEDNAWFENPVMSREHAELIAKFDEKPIAVYIKDVASFHGTFHTADNGHNKEQRLGPNELVKLTNGDLIRFGIDIFRAEKSYPPCSVEFSMEMPQTPSVLPHRGFTVPDYIDDEDEDNESEQGSVTAFLKYRANLNSSGPKGATPVIGSRPSPIDLTADGDDVLPRIAKIPSLPTMNSSTISDVIDLTSEPNYESDVEVCAVNPIVPRPSRFDASSAPASSNSRAGSLASVGIVQTSDGRIVMPSSMTVPSDDEGVYMHTGAWSDEDAESVLSDNSQPESIHSLGATDDVLSQHHDDTSSEVEDYYDSDAFSYSEQATESENNDINSIFNEDEDDDDEEDDEVNDEDAAHESSDEQPNTATLLHLSTTVQGQNNSEASTIPVIPFGYTSLGPTSPIRSFTTRNPSHGRDPSPSDAALFKRLPLLDNPPSASRAQQLGEKSGKFEFFAAREKNRAALHQNHSTVPISALRETLSVAPHDDNNAAMATTSDTSRSASPSLPSAPETTVSAKEVEGNMPEGSPKVPDVAEAPDAPDAPDASSIKLGDTDTNQYSAWTASGDQFINNPPTDEPSAPQIAHQPADFDMTSAYKFQQSKLATVTETVSQTRRLPIKDLLAQEPKQCLADSEPAPKLPTPIDPPANCAPTAAKRSYGEAFNQTEDDTTLEFAAHVVIAPCSPSLSEVKRQDQTTQEQVDIPAPQNNTVSKRNRDVGEQDIFAHEPAVIFVPPEAHRPAKRMRLATVAAQVVACVALGGAATFSYLVNTAPVF
ncbi:hypothetical protein F5Y10DRAFT_238910 [Nemania abortiva]|nr:hypothetical protein F5Y10DRAFT_238910 [Nemania abortiva]